MKELAEYIIKNLVSQPDEVVVEEEQNEEGLTLYVRVAQEDMGTVIGKAGATIKAIRKILTIRAVADRIRVNIRILDDERAPA